MTKEANEFRKLFTMDDINRSMKECRTEIELKISDMYHIPSIDPAFYSAQKEYLLSLVNRYVGLWEFRNK